VVVNADARLRKEWFRDSSPGRFADEALEELRKLEITPIVDLCHFGVPDFIGDFQNPDFPLLLSRYARAFALRYPWISTCERMRYS
jgi:beta-glucosidase